MFLHGDLNEPFVLDHLLRSVNEMLSEARASKCGKDVEARKNKLKLFMLKPHEILLFPRKIRIENMSIFR